MRPTPQELGFLPDKKIGLSSFFALSKASCPHGYLKITQQLINDITTAFRNVWIPVSALTSPQGCVRVAADRATSRWLTCWCACQEGMMVLHPLMPCSYRQMNWTHTHIYNGCLLVVYVLFEIMWRSLQTKYLYISISQYYVSQYRINSQKH